MLFAAMYSMLYDLGATSQCNGVNIMFFFLNILPSPISLVWIHSILENNRNKMHTVKLPLDFHIDGYGCQYDLQNGYAFNDTNDQYL